jgi:hypothetical protein
MDIESGMDIDMDGDVDVNVGTNKDLDIHTDITKIADCVIIIQSIFYEINKIN